MGRQGRVNVRTLAHEALVVFQYAFQLVKILQSHPCYSVCSAMLCRGSEMLRLMFSKRTGRVLW